MQTQAITIVNKLGLHARASAKLTQTAGKFPCAIHLSRNGKRVNAKSIMGVMMLAAGLGSTVEIETDGAITPREALASAGATLRSLVQLVEEMSDEPEGLTLGEAPAAASGSPDLDLPIEDLDLSERPRNCLKRAQVNSIGELLTKTEDDLLAITNFGQKSLDEVIAKLDERGLSLRGSRS